MTTADADANATLRADLLSAIAAAQPDGTYDDDAFARVHAAIAALIPLTPTPSPFTTPQVVAGLWRSLYAQYGPRHTAGQPVRHRTTMNLQSFNKFPAIDIAVDGIDQEISGDGTAYHNIVTVSPATGGRHAELIVRGRYTMAAELPQRYAVDFHAVELRAAGIADDDLRAAFGLSEGSALHHELKPMKLHSDVVYCDDDIRINFGSMGGVYVLRRLRS